MLKTGEQFLVHRVLSLDDTPHRIALGVAIGIFVTWTPTIGIQMALTVALCFLFRANKLVGVPFVWISNPVTIVPVYYPNYVVGCWMLGKKADAWNLIEQAFQFNGGWWDTTVNWFTSIMKIFWELWLGSIIVGGALGIISYFVIYWLVVQYRKGILRWHKKHDHPGTQEEVIQAVIVNDESGTKAVSQEPSAESVQQVTPSGTVRDI
ncbi:MAG TPA: DUF2062 domain-containing protein [Phycisphaerae bacterium]|nr:DUF2062 domain-containing protein [Phycisphaerae bacterium]